MGPINSYYQWAQGCTRTFGSTFLFAGDLVRLGEVAGSGGGVYKRYCLDTRLRHERTSYQFCRFILKKDLSTRFAFLRRGAILISYQDCFQRIRRRGW